MKFLMFVIALLAACATSHVKVAPVTVEPIHMTIDVNVHDTAAVADTQDEAAAAEPRP